jgi:hypothetical protein
MTKRQQDRARHAAITAVAALWQFDGPADPIDLDAEKRIAALARWRGEEIEEIKALPPDDS